MTTLVLTVGFTLAPLTLHTLSKDFDQEVLYVIGLILFMGAFLVSAVFVVYYAYVCTKSVPTDSLVIK